MLYLKILPGKHEKIKKIGGLMNDITFAFLLTLLAGLSTGIGGLIVFFSKTDNRKFLSIALGFSAGVMIYVSFVEILNKSQSTLANQMDQKMAAFLTLIAFLIGMLSIGLIDFLIPKEENPHEFNYYTKNDDIKKLKRIGLFTALAIAIHNFPEGLATFLVAMQDPVMAIPVIIAIALHNIPEGIAVAMPIYYATNSKKKALLYSFGSGLTEPLGAIIGWLILMPIMNDTVFGMVFAAVAGIMVFISLDELLPSAQEFGEHHLSIYGMVAGMAVMGISLVLL